MAANAPSLPAKAVPSSPGRQLRVVLVGNYPPDGQESMQRFALALFEGLRSAGYHVELLVPRVIVGRWAKSTTNGIGKWLGYIDKYLIFPLRFCSTLKARAKAGNALVIAHICDHSNSVYARCAGNVPVVVTCHDLLAVRGALGEQTDCPATFWGRQLQHAIVRGLAAASVIVSVSSATRRDVDRVVGPAVRHQDRCLVHMGLNYCYRRLEANLVEARLESVGLRGRLYILHVGSNLRRKNRDGVLRIFAMTLNNFGGLLVFAGEGLNEGGWALAHSLGVSDRVVEVSKPDSPLLEALYNGATALLFPSRFEGFGWPVIEAQACGCPVVCGNAEPLPEIVGEGGIVCPLDDESAFAAAILRLTDSVERKHWSHHGLANASKFTTARMIESYIEAYERVEVAK
jgi:glycosyltransferase involved in cell wall biosynthesis